MQTTPPNNQLQNLGNTRLRLPFEKRKVDFVTWTYVHRAGIYMIVIVFLLFGITFVSCKIQVGHKVEEGATTVLLDFQEVPTPKEERLAQLAAQGGQGYDYSDISNRTSNENARQNSRIRDEQGTSASELRSQANRLNEQMAENRAAYEAGLRSEQQILSGGGGGAGSGAGSGTGNRSGSISGNQSGAGAGSGSQEQVTKVSGGAVTVSFSFRDPVRTASRNDIVVPAYMCEGGGEVVVNVTLNRNGDVISASADRARSSPDEHMRATAEKAARNSRFNVDNSAPAKHSGTITYIFVPQ